MRIKSISAFSLIIILLFTACNNEKKSISPFYGEWCRMDEDESSAFAITIGQQGDSLLFGIFGVVNNGLNMDFPDLDAAENLIPQAKALIPTTDSVIITYLHGFNRDNSYKYNSAKLTLLNDTTLCWESDAIPHCFPSKAILTKRGEDAEVFAKQLN